MVKDALSREVKYTTHRSFITMVKETYSTVQQPAEFVEARHEARRVAVHG